MSGLAIALMSPSIAFAADMSGDGFPRAPFRPEA